MTRIHMHESQLFTSSTKHVTSTVGLMGLVRPFIADTLLVRFLTGISTSAHAFCSWDTTACAYYCPYESFSCITGPTTVNVRVTGLTPGLHGFHLVSVVLLCNQLLISTPCFVRIMIHLFVLQHEFGDTTNGCISTGRDFHPTISVIWCYSGYRFMHPCWCLRSENKLSHLVAQATKCLFVYIILTDQNLIFRTAFQPKQFDTRCARRWSPPCGWPGKHCCQCWG